MIRVLNWIGSLKAALLCMALLALVVFLDLRAGTLPSGWLTVVLCLLAISLLTAMAVRPQFRRQPGLLIFHLCLAALAGLAAVETLTVFDGQLEQAEGTPFNADYVDVVKQGPWHVADRLRTVQFIQGPIAVEYRPELRRGSTSSTVYRDVEGQSLATVFGGTRALRSRGYRFVTTPNKGFALTLVWTDASGAQAAGNVHMPSYPLLEWAQSQSWETPVGEIVTLRLDLPPAPVDRAWTLTGDTFDGRVLLGKPDGSEHELRPGAPVALAGGTLELSNVALWIGYRVEGNRILPWMFASAALGVAALGWHFWRNPPKYRPAGMVSHVA
jgi:hypothetical protein